MELEIQDKRENHLMARTEVHFIVHHPNSPTPKRDAVRDELSKSLKAPKERIVVDHMNSHFGLHDTRGYAKIYASKEEAMKVEREYLLKRNRLVKEEKKEKKEEAAPEPAEEKPEEEPAKEEPKEG